MAVSQKRKRNPFWQAHKDYVDRMPAAKAEAAAEHLAKMKRNGYTSDSMDDNDEFFNPDSHKMAPTSSRSGIDPDPNPNPNPNSNPNP